MANNFKIILHKEKKNLHLKLKGDFDGTSACELISVLKGTTHPDKIFIHTNGLKKIFLFGSEVFKSHTFTLNGNACKLIFTGKNKYHFMLEKK